MEETTIYLVRHGEAAGNLARTFQGSTDVPLTQKGLEQAECLGERFRNEPLDALFCTPLLRTRQTAQAVGKYHSVPIQTVPELIEINGGGFEGLSWTELARRYPEAYEDWEKRPARFQAPHGESMRQVYERVSRALERIAQENQGKTVLAVCHGCVIRNALCYAKGFPLERIQEVGWAENTGVSKVVYRGDLLPRLMLENDASHLPEKLRTIFA